MDYEVILAKTAVETYDAIYEQIVSKFGDSAAKKFEAKVIRTFETLTLTPFIFRATQENSNVRKGWIHKNCSFFYEVSDFQIHVLFFWDNRQEPLMEPDRLE